MTAPFNDADRIIAAQAAQAHKTRVLLVWLLLGIPAAAGIIWGLIVLGIMTSGPSQPVNTGPAPTPVQVPDITDTTSCASINTGVTDLAVSQYAGAPEDFVSHAFVNECQDHPDWTAGRALAQAKQDFAAPSR